MAPPRHRGPLRRNKPEIIKASVAPDEIGLPPDEGALPLGGSDDVGRAYATLGDLWLYQCLEREALYAANAAWWAAGGYGGATDECTMIGDEDSAVETAESASFLNGLIQRRRLCIRAALDGGAGVGRVTKYVLLKRAGHVTLLEPDVAISKQSRRYLGKKRAASCDFLIARLEDYAPQPGTFDLVWVQWVLQYLIDADAVRALRQLATGLTATGCIVLKENRPYLPGTDHSQFVMDTPGGENKRFDITRSDAHHQALFRLAGVTVAECHRGLETNTWVLHHRGFTAELATRPEAVSSGCGAAQSTDCSARSNSDEISTSCLNGQSATAGLMPPSESEDESEGGRSNAS